LKPLLIEIIVIYLQDKQIKFAHFKYMEDSAEISDFFITYFNNTATS